jgi:hypothetical protein
MSLRNWHPVLQVNRELKVAVELVKPNTGLNLGFKVDVLIRLEESLEEVVAKSNQARICLRYADYIRDSYSVSAISH